MGAKECQVKLSLAEINHLSGLLANNEREGWYYAPAVQYWDRHKRIARKLTCALTGGKETVQRITGKGTQ